MLILERNGILHRKSSQSSRKTPLGHATVSLDSPFTTCTSTSSFTHYSLLPATFNTTWHTHPNTIRYHYTSTTTSFNITPKLGQITFSTTPTTILTTTSTFTTITFPITHHHPKREAISKNLPT